ncbi:esterase/lipase family protein [Pseudoduganella danionis]|uniref:esterase/lipase family protein n=1 Tax=Pseudoduganella danionis TaxID=1890295 RepID=UPI0035B16584
MNLTKQEQLQRALNDAARDIVRPPLTLAAISMPLSAAQIADSNLNIVRNKDTGCIQFIFPGHRAPQLDSAPASAMDWLVHAALRIREEITQGMIETMESHSKPERLLKLGTGWQQPATAQDLATARGRKVLLMVHGICSSSEGAFSELERDGTLATLVDRYQGQVYGYDHWTIAKTPQQNALDLLQLLPADGQWQLDVLCHSRGGLVVRSLLAEATQDSTLAAIRIARRGRIASVGAAIFVAAANQGTPLAQPADVQSFLNIAAMLATISGALGLDLVIALARLVLNQGLQRPSIAALASQSALQAQLAAGSSLLAAARVYYARADFAYGGSALEQTGALINHLLISADNDVIVPYDSVLLPQAAPAADHLLDFGTPQKRQSEVWHTEFFRQPAMREFILRAVRSSA